MQHPHFIDADGSFTLERPEEISQLYFLLASEDGLKSCVSPDLGGDAKVDAALAGALRGGFPVQHKR